MFRRKEDKKCQKWSNDKSFAYLLRDGSVSLLASLDAGMYTLCVRTADASGRCAEAVDLATYRLLCGWSCCTGPPHKSKKMLRAERRAQQASEQQAREQKQAREQWARATARATADALQASLNAGYVSLDAGYVQTKTRVCSKAAYFQTRPPPVDDGEDLPQAMRPPVSSGGKGHKILAYFRTRPPVSSSEELSYAHEEELSYAREEIIASDMVEVMVLSNGTMVDQDHQVLEILPSHKHRFEEAYASLLAKMSGKKLKFHTEMADKKLEFHPIRDTPVYTRFHYNQDTCRSVGSNDAASIEVHPTDTVTTETVQ